MIKLTIILLLVFSFWPAAVVCDCQLRENARDLLYVGYFSASNYTYVDMIEVGMMERKTKFGRLLFNEDCSEKIKNTKLSAAFYKISGKSSELVDEKEQKAGFIRFEQLDPCAVYEVNVTIGNHEVGSYTVGPYHIQDDVQHPFLSSDENREYEKRKGEIKDVTPYKDKAVIELGPICARMVMIHLREKQSNGATHQWDMEKTTIPNVTERITPHKVIGAKLVVENLQPCTQYTVDIELWLDDERSTTEEGDFKKDQVFDFYTMPEDGGKLPKDCWKPKKERERQILQITTVISILVILIATILACSLTFCRRQQGQLEMKKLLPDSPSRSPPVVKTIVPIEPDPETDKQTVVLLKYADLSKTY